MKFKEYLETTKTKEPLEEAKSNAYHDIMDAYAYASGEIVEIRGNDILKGRDKIGTVKDVGNGLLVNMSNFGRTNKKEFMKELSKKRNITFDEFENSILVR